MAGGKAFFEWKCNGSKNCEYNDAKCLSMCYFVFQAQKKISCGFYSTVVGDVTGIQ